MANVWIEENTMKAIGDAIRAKTGKTDLILPADMPMEIARITGGESGRTEILSERVLNFTYAQTYGAYLNDSNPSLFVPVAGETYVIVWDGTEYFVTATTHENFPEQVLFGNTLLIGGLNTGEPFAVASRTDGSGMTIFSLDANETHTIAVYQETGGSSDLVKYVTFMSEDGTTELFKMPVLKGDDCKDAVSHGDISKPTKESSNTTNYTYSGWSLTSGDSADSNALKNVTEDRTVYASFAESVRYYTVNFYTEVGVLHETVQVTYGGTATPSKNPEKSGYGFVGWNPSNENITSDTNCYAIWEESVSFANGSWADIAMISESGQASSVFKIGDTKIIPYGDSQIELMIVGFNHDELTSGDGKAGITIISKNFIPDDFLWATSSTTRYPNSTVCTSLKNTVLGKLPTELQNVIKSVNKEYVNAPDKPSDGSVSVATTALKLWNPSAVEIGYEESMTSDYTFSIGTVYEGFKTTPLSVKNNTGVNQTVWLRDQAIKSNGNYNISSKTAVLLITPAGSTSVSHITDIGNKRESIIGFCI